MKLYVDDIREAPDESWTLARTITEAIRFIAAFGGDITEISLNHDISFEVRVQGVYRPFPSPDDFTPVAFFTGEKYSSNAILKNAGIVSTCFCANCPERTGGECMIGRVPKITVHSANPLAGEKIESILKSYLMTCEIKMMGEAFRKK